ncbi:MAG: quinone-dependent dihydroorotate dehydrogenase [Campylobacter sp.]|nr:quinone-dependent dihydroorotate dehydrogenase [Campylobacter sp.]
MKYENLKKWFFKMDPEQAHDAAINWLKTANTFPLLVNICGMGLVVNKDILKQEILGLNFPNPVGLAGGFDKDGVVLKSLKNLGFGHIEYGTVTPLPQKGNEKPRLFRLIKNESIQNCMGFNNLGAKAVKANVSKFYPLNVPLIANIGKNKFTPNSEALKDYLSLANSLDSVCDIFLVNISSPNTPNLRLLEEKTFIEDLFLNLKEITSKPIALKISPDLSYEKAIDICSCAVDSGAKILVINNTSVDYNLSPNIKQEKGGISGKLITHKSRELFKAVSCELFGRAVLVSCGGIDSAKEAYTRIRLGASLFQIYTSFIYKGPSIARDINLELAKLLREDGFANIKDAVGVDIKKGGM